MRRTHLFAMGFFVDAQDQGLFLGSWIRPKTYQRHPPSMRPGAAALSRAWVYGPESAGDGHLRWTNVLLWPATSWAANQLQLTIHSATARKGECECE